MFTYKICYFQYISMEQLFDNQTVIQLSNALLFHFSFNCLAYMLILENDSNAEVRRAVLSCIAMSPRTLPKVIKRTQDIKENVRKLAYQVATNAVKYGGINVHVHMQQHNKSCVLYLTKHLFFFNFKRTFYLCLFSI